MFICGMVSKGTITIPDQWNPMMPSRLKRLLTRSYPFRFFYWLCVLNFVDLTAKYWPVKKKARSLRRIVVFLRPEGIGDYVIWTGAFDAIEYGFPSNEYEKILVGNKLWSELAELSDVFDRKIFIDPPRMLIDPLYRYKIMRAIRRLGADQIVNTRLSREFILTDSMVRVSRSPVRIGSQGIANRMTGVQKWISDRWYTRLESSPKCEDHELESAVKFLNAITGQSNVSPGIGTLPDAGVEINHQISGQYAVFFIGAQLPDKQWPAERFAAAAEFVSRKFGIAIVIAGGPNDKDHAARFRQSFAEPCIDLVGKLSLLEMSSLIRSALFVVSNDTGAAHIAVANLRPTIVLTPGNHVGRFFPYPNNRLNGEKARQISVTHPLPCFGCDWHCKFTEMDPRLPKPCISEIGVESVTDAIDSMVQSHYPELCKPEIETAN